jgi:hypothetical protein
MALEMRPGDKVLYTLPEGDMEAGEILTRLWTAARTILATNPKHDAANVRLSGTIGGEECEIEFTLKRAQRRGEPR